MKKFKVGDLVSFQGFDGCKSIDTIYDAWDSPEGQWVELDKNEIAIGPAERERINLELYKEAIR